MRLDAALAFFLPGMGLRGRRRLWTWCRVMVNGRDRAPGFAVLAGDCVRIVPVDGRAGVEDLTKVIAKACAGASFPDAFLSLPWPCLRNDRQFDLRQEAVPEASFVAAVRLVAASKDFVALHKPRGLHSAHIAGGRAASLEALLPVYWERLWKDCRLTEAFCGGASSLPVLLTRLDRDTSGIVLGAMNGEAAGRFRVAERQGLACKHYFAVLRGSLPYPIVITKRLATDARVTRVLDEEESDGARHTRVSPLAAVEGRGGVGEDGPVDASSAAGCREGASGIAATLAHVQIARGARHQIRAHLAAAGFPLVGDRLYSPRAALREKSASFFYLHHAKVTFPGFSALDMPGWNLGEDAAHL
jgi:23S rRNA pseudouridine1911/1915/1917 synthase